MTKSIDDRAIAWSEQHRDIYMCNADVIAELSYKQGATEQKQIDIDKACLEFMRLIQGLCQNRDHEDALYFKFRKAMEECVLNTTD